MTTKKPTSKDIAQKQWEVENDIKADDIYKYDETKYNALMEKKPWNSDPVFFKKAKISALALLKMVMHATRGGDIEVMGLMQGRVDEEGNFIILDSFALPVEASETRVNAANEAFEYTGTYLDMSAEVNRKETVVGWYHSHPGYNVFLSGIDVNTQKSNQKFQDPFVAVVIDPKATISMGKVVVGAFRTYPEGYKPSASASDEYMNIPSHKIEDYGVYANQYYRLEVEFFKSSTDASLLGLLWNKYWTKILASSPLTKNFSYINGAIADIATKLEKVEGEVSRSGGSLHMMPSETGGNKKEKKQESQLSKVTKDATKISCECIHGELFQVLKNYLFNLKAK